MDIKVNLWRQESNQEIKQVNTKTVSYYVETLNKVDADYIDQDYDYACDPTVEGEGDRFVKKCWNCRETAKDHCEIVVAGVVFLGSRLVWIGSL